MNTTRGFTHTLPQRLDAPPLHRLVIDGIEGHVCRPSPEPEPEDLSRKTFRFKVAQFDNSGRRSAHDAQLFKEREWVT